ncbi:MAG TPA: hypothetical protein VGH19_03335, partial [Verrucomicrobiae bacterium]
LQICRRTSSFERCWFECFFVFTCSVWRSQNPQTSIFCFYSCGLLLIHNVKNSKGLTGTKGRNPLDDFTIEVEDPIFGAWGTKYQKPLSSIFPAYDWVYDNGRKNMPSWIEEAAKIAGR